MAKYKIKPATLEGYLWTGKYDEKTTPRWLIAAMKKPGAEIGAVRIRNNEIIDILTDKGKMVAYKGDLVVRDAQGEIFPMRKQVLELLNAEVSE